jgi:hypothetical protein
VRLLWEGAVAADGFSGNVNGSNVSGVVGVGVANGYYEVGVEYYSLSGASGVSCTIPLDFGSILAAFSVRSSSSFVVFAS